MTENTNTQIKDIYDRARRIETRLMKFFEWQGFETETSKPELHGTSLRIPSPSCSLKDILEALPPDGEVYNIVIHGTLLATITKEGE